MTTLIEGDLQFTFSGALNARKFDAPGHGGHGLSHCMKAVDFIVEMADHCLFIEVKDPQGSLVIDQGFVASLKAGAIDSDFMYKYRDSFLYEWASDRTNKPIHYYILLALDTLGKPLLAARTNALKQNLPLQGPRSIPWPRPFVHGCAVFNIASWNEHLPQHPVTRLSAIATPAS